MINKLVERAPSPRSAVHCARSSRRDAQRHPGSGVRDRPGDRGPLRHLRAGAEIPDRSCSFLIGSDTSPQLSWGTLPDSTEALLLIMEDIDTPTRKPAIHMAVVFAADRSELAEGELVPDPKFSYLRHRRVEPRYFGPRPLPGHGPHRYRFQLYALDVSIKLNGLRNVDQLPAAVAGHVLAAGMLEGTRTAP